jgi:hypothetical protein
MCAGDAANSLPQTMRSERACIRDAQSRALAEADALRTAGQPLLGTARLARSASSN